MPNGLQGFLKSNINYCEGQKVVLLSRVFFDLEKPQAFTDKLKIISKYFILKLGDSGFSFSKKIHENFSKEKLKPILEEQIKYNNGVFIICRSKIAEISIEQSRGELVKILQHYKLIKKSYLKRIYIMMVTQKKLH